LRQLSTFAGPSLRTILGGSVAERSAQRLADRATAYSALDVTVDHGVATVLLNRPKKQNALNIPMWNELIDCFDAVSADPTVRVAVLDGAGDHFCSGMDLGVFSELGVLYREESCPGRRSELVYRVVKFFQAGVSAPELCTKPVIGVMDGNVVGGAVDLITACDFRYAAAGARLCVKEVDRDHDLLSASATFT
jgi:enoyl-CoA hydratase